jgi:FKBP-type peptidyl-prolyl cis-trans isomerase FkpA
MKYLILIFTFLTVISCSKDITPEEQYNLDIKLIEDYLKLNNITTAQKTPQGIYYTVVKEGGVDKPKLTSTVTVAYKGYFLDNVTFDSSDKFATPLYNVIQGWQIGIPKFGKGGKGTLYIPSQYGYGTGEVQGRKSVVLAFDIELIDF